MKETEKKKKKGFQQELRIIDVWGLALGAIIGWGCFVLPGTSFLPGGGPLGAALGLLAGAGMICIISFSYGYMIRKYPVSGGEFVYALEAFGEKHAFICGWFIILAYWSLIPLNATALALICRNLFPGLIEIGKLYEIAGWDVYGGELALALAVIGGLGLLNIKGIKSAGWIQTFTAVTLVLVIAAIGAAVLVTKPDVSRLQPLFEPGKSRAACIAAVMAYAPYCFVGFDCVPQAAEEYKFSHKKATAIMASAIFAAGLLYICVNTVTALIGTDGTGTWTEGLQNIDWATGAVVKQLLGNAGLLFAGVAMLCAVTSGMNAFYISSSRLMYSMAQYKALPSVFGRLGSSGTPKNAVVFLMVLSMIAPFFGRQVLVWIVDMTSIGAACGFCYTTASACRTAKKEGDRKHMILGLLGCVLGSVFIILTCIPGMPGFLSVQSWICLGVWIILGTAFYLWRRRSSV